MVRQIYQIARTKFGQIALQMEYIRQFMTFEFYEFKKIYGKGLDDLLMGLYKSSVPAFNLGYSIPKRCFPYKRVINF